MNPIVHSWCAAGALVLAACATGTSLPSATTPPAQASRASAIAQTSPAEATPSAPSQTSPAGIAPSAPTQTAAAEPVPGARTKSVPPPAPTPKSPSPHAAAAAPKKPPAGSPPKVSPSTTAAAPAAPAKAPAQAAPAPLDLKSLEERLKETNAIGVLTKLSLKNQVDDLIAKFKAYHQGARPPTLSDLRPSFDLLLMKVLSLLQDKDPALAHDIDASRGAIWGVLNDPRKLAQFS